MAGAIDPEAWSLVSNLAAGEPPRFAPTVTASSTGDPWSSIGSNGAGNGALNGGVLAVAVSGADLYVGGLFTNVAGIAEADYVAHWNGVAWSAMGSRGAGLGALTGPASAVAVVGSFVYVGGLFINVANIATADHLARWDGIAWSALGSNGSGDGALNGTVYALAASGPDLFVGGTFENAGGVATADDVARWNGSVWSGLGANATGTDGPLGPLPGEGTNKQVFALAVLGSDVYVGGMFLDAGGVAKADYLARWNGVSWSALGSNGGTGGPLADVVRALTVSGSNLFVGGSFLDAGGVPKADRVARWNGSAWSALGSNPANTDGALNGDVRALATLGGDLYVSGSFTNAAGLTGASYIARWAASSWSALGVNGTGPNGVVATLAVAGNSLLAGGTFTDIAGTEGDNLARWNLASTLGWAALGSDGAGDGALTDQVLAVAVSGGDLYLGGRFLNAGGIAKADYLARWNGKTWSAVGSDAAGTNGALNAVVYALAVAGNILYVGGGFTNAGGAPTADYLARWNGVAWSAVGPSGGSLNSGVYSLAVAGNVLLVGGLFTDGAGNPKGDRLLLWNGTAWLAFGSHGANGALNNAVRAIAVVGTVIYAGGLFTDVDGESRADYVAAWNGFGWFALGSDGGSNGALNALVRTMTVMNGDLYVAGEFTHVSGPSARIGRWDGSAWSTIPGVSNGSIDSMATFGGDLLIAGGFASAGGVPHTAYLARWGGASWSSLYAGDAAAPISNSVFALASTGIDLEVGGAFHNAVGIPEADYAATTRLIGATYQPDGRIKKGQGAFVGDDIHNSTGLNQVRTGSAAPGSTVTFTISIQNDGDGDDAFRLLSTGSASGYSVAYSSGTTDITTAVVNGTYQTTVLAPGGTYSVKAKVTVLAGAAAGSSVSCRVTITSVNDSAKVDAVKFTVSRS
jgi:trimeric autotransporter adhesin